MMRKGNSGVNVVMETRRRSKLVATNYPQNMLAQRRLCSTYTGIDKAKAKKLTEMDMQMRLMKYRQKNISSKKRMGNNLNETFFFQPGFRFRRNGDVRELHSGFTEVRLPDLENVFLAHRAGGLMCTVPHKHDETCRISAMSMDELDAEISKLSRELSNVKEDADKVISDHKEKTARHQPVNYLHAHTNDFTPDLEMVRSSSSVRSSIRPNCVACHFDIKASTSESELHRFLQRRNEHWTRWKIAPSGKYSNKSYVPNLMFSYKDIDKDESTSSTSSRSKSMNNVKAKQSTKGLTDKSIDAVFKANQTAFEKANLKKIETASSVRDQSTSDQSPKVPKKGVLKNKGKLNLNGTTSETKADKLRVKLLKMMVNQPNSELSVSEDAMYDDYFASSDTTPEWSLFPASDTVDEEPLRTERTDDTLANLTFRSQTFDSDRPVESTWSADSTDAYMGSNRSKKQVTFSQYNLRGHGSGQPQQVRSCCNRSVDDSLRPVDDSLKEEVDGEDSYESISAKDVLKEKAVSCSKEYFMIKSHCFRISLKSKYIKFILSESLIIYLTIKRKI